MKNFIYALFLFPSLLSAQSITEHPRVREAMHLLDLWLDAQQAYEEIPGISAGVVEVLKPNTLREIYRVHWLEPDWSVAWGLGFAVWKGEEKRFVGHGGSCPGYRTHLAIQPEKKISTIFLSNAMGVNPNFHTQKMFEIMAPAIEQAKKDIESKDDKESEKAHPDWEKYCGIYGAGPWGGEAAVIMWKGQLAMLRLPSRDPLEGLVKLKHKEGNIFQRVRKDEDLGKTIRFEVDDSGTVRRMWQHSNFSNKLR